MAGRDEQDVQQLAGIVLSTFLLACGLLACGLALPLRWQPGQLPVLVATLALAPGMMAAAQWRAAQQTGLAARASLGRARAAVWALIVLGVVVAPAISRQLVSPRDTQLSTAFVLPIACGLALCWLATSTASAFAVRWDTLHPQAWETGVASERAALWTETTRQGRVNRTEILATFWRDWAGGAIGLALALLAAGRGASPALGWGFAAFVGYLLLGPLLIGRAARLRWQTQWRLDHLDVERTVAAEWTVQSLWPVLGVLLCAALVVSVGFLALANAFVLWLAAILAPRLDRLLALLGGLFHFDAPSVSSALRDATRTAPRRPPVARPPSARATAHVHAPEVLVWLGQHWYLVAAIAALAVLALSARAGGARARVAEARAVALAVLRGLRALFAAARRPLERWVDSAVQNTRARAASLAGRRMRGRVDPSRLPPRKAVIALYLAALGLLGRRAGQRRPAQTPEEYARQVGEQYPQLQEHLAGMTGLFMRTRYSPGQVGDAERARMSAFWSALRAALRHIPRAERRS